MGNRRRGFTLAELVVGVVVMIVTLGVTTMSLRSTDQTAKREAERLAAYIYRQMDKAVRIHKGFTMTVGTDSVLIQWGNLDDDNSFKASDGCSYNLQGSRKYNASKQSFPQGATINVYDARGGQCDVILATQTEGRITISPQY